MSTVRVSSELDLTAAERELCRAAGVGAIIDLKGQTVRGAVVRELLVRLQSDDTRAVDGLSLFGGTISDGLPLHDCKIGGPLSFSECKFTSGAGKPAVTLCDAILASVAFQSCEIGGAILADRVQLEADFILQQSPLKGTLHLEDANVGNLLACEQSEIDGDGVAVVANGLNVGGSLEFNQSKFIGQVLCRESVVHGQFRFVGSRLFGSEFGLFADGIQIHGMCNFSKAMVIGPISLSGAYIRKCLKFTAASLKVDGGVCVFAHRLKVGGDVKLNNGFVTAGGVHLDRAQIEGTLDLSHSQICSSFVRGRGQAHSGPIVFDGWTKGASSAPKHSGSDRNGDVIALSLVDAVVYRLRLPERAEHRPCGVVDYSRANVHVFEDYAGSWPHPYDERDLTDEGRDFDYHILDGLSYGHLSNPTGVRERDHAMRWAKSRIAGKRMLWLAGQSEKDIREQFKSQPWSRLSRWLAEQGLGKESEKIAIARKRFEAASASLSLLGKLQSRFMDIFTLYGFSPWRTVLWMFVFVLGFAVLWGFSAAQCTAPGCMDETVFVMTKRASYEGNKSLESYPGFHPLGYSLDVFVPFVSIGYADHWRVNTMWRPLGFVRVPEPIRFLFVGGPMKRDSARVQNERPATDGVVVTAGGLLHILMITEVILGSLFIVLAVAGFAGFLKSS